MRNQQQLTKTQIILNNANYKQDFTINISKEKSIENRYIVSSFNLYEGKNASLDFDLFDKVDNIININKGLFDSIGGWLNKETNIYSLDANIHFNDINFALKFAKANKQTAIFDKVENKEIYLNITKNL